MKDRILTSSQFPIRRERRVSYEHSSYIPPPPTTAIPISVAARNRSLKHDLWKKQSQNQPIFYDLTPDDDDDDDKKKGENEEGNSSNGGSRNVASIVNVNGESERNSTSNSNISIDSNVLVDLSDFAEYDPSSRHKLNDNGNILTSLSLSITNNGSNNRKTEASFASFAAAKAEIEKKKKLQEQQQGQHQQATKQPVIVEILDDDSDSDSVNPSLPNDRKGGTCAAFTGRSSNDKQPSTVEIVTSSLSLPPIASPTLNQDVHKTAANTTTMTSVRQMESDTVDHSVDFAHEPITESQPTGVVAGGSISAATTPCEPLNDPEPANPTRGTASKRLPFTSTCRQIDTNTNMNKNTVPNYRNKLPMLQSHTRARVVAPSTIEVCNHSFINCLSNWYICKVDCEDITDIEDDTKVEPVPLPESNTFEKCSIDDDDDDYGSTDKHYEYRLVGWLKRSGTVSSDSSTSQRIMLRNLVSLSFEPNRDMRGYWIAVGPQTPALAQAESSKIVTPLDDPVDDDVYSESGTTISSRSDPFFPTAHRRKQAFSTDKNLTYYWLKEPYQPASTSTKQQTLSSFLHWNHRLALIIMSCIYDEFFASSEASTFARIKIEELIKEPNLSAIFRAEASNKSDIDLNWIASCKGIIVSLLPGTNQWITSSCPLVKSIDALPKPRKQMFKSILSKVQQIEKKILQYAWDGPMNNNHSRESLTNGARIESNGLQNVIASANANANDFQEKQRNDNCRDRNGKFKSGKKRAVGSSETSKTGELANQTEQTVANVTRPGAEHCSKSKARRQKLHRQFESYRSNEEEKKEYNDEPESTNDGNSFENSPTRRGSEAYGRSKRPIVCKNPYEIRIKPSVLSKNQIFSVPKVDIPAYKRDIAKSKAKRTLIPQFTGVFSPAHYHYSTDRMKQALIDFRASLEPKPCGSDSTQTWLQIKNKNFAFTDEDTAKELFTRVADLDIEHWPFESYLLIVQAMANTCQRAATIARKFLFHWRGAMTTNRSAFVILNSCVDHAVAIINELSKHGSFEDLEKSTAFYFLIAVLSLIEKATFIEHRKHLEILKENTIDLQDVLEKIKETEFFKNFEDSELRRVHKRARDKLIQADKKQPSSTLSHLKEPHQQMVSKKPPPLLIGGASVSVQKPSKQTGIVDFAEHIPRKSSASSQNCSRSLVSKETRGYSTLRKICSIVNQNSCSNIGERNNVNVNHSLEQKSQMGQPFLSSNRPCETFTLGSSSSSGNGLKRRFAQLSTNQSRQIPLETWTNDSNDSSFHQPVDLDWNQSLDSQPVASVAPLETFTLGSSSNGRSFKRRIPSSMNAGKDPIEKRSLDFGSHQPVEQDRNKQQVPQLAPPSRPCETFTLGSSSNSKGFKRKFSGSFNVNQARHSSIVEQGQNQQQVSQPPSSSNPSETFALYSSTTNGAVQNRTDNCTNDSASHMLAGQNRNGSLVSETVKPLETFTLGSSTKGKSFRRRMPCSMTANQPRCGPTAIRTNEFTSYPPTEQDTNQAQLCKATPAPGPSDKFSLGSAQNAVDNSANDSSSHPSTVQDRHQSLVSQSVTLVRPIETFTLGSSSGGRRLKRRVSGWPNENNAKNDAIEKTANNSIANQPVEQEQSPSPMSQATTFVCTSETATTSQSSFTSCSSSANEVRKNVINKSTNDSTSVERDLHQSLGSQSVTSVRPIETFTLGSSSGRRFKRRVSGWLNANNAEDDAIEKTANNSISNQPVEQDHSDSRMPEPSTFVGGQSFALDSSYATNSRHHEIDKNSNDCTSHQSVEHDRNHSSVSESVASVRPIETFTLGSSSNGRRFKRRVSWLDANNAKNDAIEKTADNSTSNRPVEQEQYGSCMSQSSAFVGSAAMGQSTSIPCNDISEAKFDSPHISETIQDPNEKQTMDSTSHEQDARNQFQELPTFFLHGPSETFTSDSSGARNRGQHATDKNTDNCRTQPTADQGRNHSSVSESVAPVRPLETFTLGASSGSRRFKRRVSGWSNANNAKDNAIEKTANNLASNRPFEKGQSDSRVSQPSTVVGLSDAATMCQSTSGPRNGASETNFDSSRISETIQDPNEKRTIDSTSHEHVERDMIKFHELPPSLHGPSDTFPLCSSDASNRGQHAIDKNNTNDSTSQPTGDQDRNLSSVSESVPSVPPIETFTLGSSSNGRRFKRRVSGWLNVNHAREDPIENEYI